VERSRSAEVALSAYQENSHMVVALRGPIGASGVLRYSDDLRTWKPLQAFVLTVGSLLITDTGVPPGRNRFYAVVDQEPIVTLPDLGTTPNRVFTPGEGFDVVQYAPNGKLGLIVWRDTSLVFRERSPAGSWSESVVTDGGFGPNLSPTTIYSPLQPAALLYDSSSRAHVFRGKGSSVDHFEMNAGSWSRVESLGAPGTISRLTAAMAPGDAFHLGLHVGQSLVHASSKTGWNWSTVDSVQSDPQWMPASYSRRWLSMAVDSRGAAYFVYRPTFDFSQHPEGYRRANTKLKFASNRSGSWVRQVVREPDDVSGEAGSGQSIAIGPNDLPAIASWYNERGDGGSSQWSRLQYYEMNSAGGWARSEVLSRPETTYIAGDGEKGTGAYPYLRFDTRGRPHIVFTDHASQHFPYQNEYAGNVRHGVRNGTSWTFETLFAQDKPIERQAVFPAFAMSGSELALLVLERRTSWNTQVNPQVATSTYRESFLTRPLN
jgi:hypothetical protein